MRVRTIGTSVLSGVLVVVLCGCGGASHKADAAADLAAAQDALIKQGDLPDYVPQPKKPNDDDRAIDKVLDQTMSSCLHVDRTFLNQDVPGEQKAKSPDYKSGYETISASIEVDPKKRTVDDAWA